MQLPNDKENPMSLGKLSNQKSNGTWELAKMGGGSSKNQKSPKFNWEKFKIRGWGLQKSKKSQVLEGIKD